MSEKGQLVRRVARPAATKRAASLLCRHLPPSSWQFQPHSHAQRGQDTIPHQPRPIPFRSGPRRTTHQMLVSVRPRRLLGVSTRRQPSPRIHSVVRFGERSQAHEETRGCLTLETSAGHLRRFSPAPARPKAMRTLPRRGMFARLLWPSSGLSVARLSCYLGHRSVSYV
jgi:hypothetical protein